jgi:hypothetical protein
MRLMIDGVNIWPRLAAVYLRSLALDPNCAFDERHALAAVSGSQHAWRNGDDRRPVASGGRAGVSTFGSDCAWPSWSWHG